MLEFGIILSLTLIASQISVKLNVILGFRLKLIGKFIYIGILFWLSWGLKLKYNAQSNPKDKVSQHLRKCPY